MSLLDILDILDIMKNRTTRTYTIDNNLYSRFEKITKDKMINRSRLIESLIENFLLNAELISLNGVPPTDEDVQFEDVK